jgi:N-acetylneuraminic acid mutarotase
MKFRSNNKKRLSSEMTFVCVSNASISFAFVLLWLLVLCEQVVNTAAAADLEWARLADAPGAMGEVGAAVLNDVLYVFGHPDARVNAFELLTGRWRALNATASRLFAGDHHTVQTFGNKLYVFGGLRGGAEGKVQIYDPVANRWTLGPDMPWASGASSSARVGDRFVVFGGLINQESQSVGNCGIFDPVAARWSDCARLVFPHNHMAGGTDGTAVFAFGGRGGSTRLDTVQRFDVTGNNWTSLTATAAVPSGGRAGMGAAPFVDGEFYVMGGEGGTSIQFHDRVDIFNPKTGQWRAGPVLPQKRHGIAPIAYNGSIYVACGGSVQFAFAPTTTLFVLRPKAPATTPSTSTSTSSASSSSSSATTTIDASSAGTSSESNSAISSSSGVATSSDSAGSTMIETSSSATTGSGSGSTSDSSSISGTSIGPTQTSGANTLAVISLALLLMAM